MKSHRRSAGDADLARGLVAKEDWAVAEMWHRFAPMVLGIAQRTLGSRTDAEDVAQDVFCCVLDKITTLRAPDRLRGFIYGIANHALKAALRRRKRQRSFTLLSSAAEEPLDSPSVDIESRDILRRFDALLSRLSPRHRLIFGLRRLEALTTEEVAAAAHVSNATVKRAVAHASRRLSCWIGADPELAALLGDARPRSRSCEAIASTHARPAGRKRAHHEAATNFHASSGTQVQRHDAEQLSAGVAPEL